jgi:hypothetical protein
MLVTMSSVLFVSMVCVTGVIWSQSIEIPIWGTQEGAEIDPGVQWVDDEGILHIRGRVITVNSAGEDAYGVPLTGTGIIVQNFNIDLVNGIGDYNGSAQYEYNYGDLVGSFEGINTGMLTGLVWEGEYNYPHGCGDFAGWKIRGTWVLLPGSVTTWEGIFHIPHGGGGGGKSIPADSHTWGSVKSLYR